MRRSRNVARRVARRTRRTRRTQRTRRTRRGSRTKKTDRRISRKSPRRSRRVSNRRRSRRLGGAVQWRKGRQLEDWEARQASKASKAAANQPKPASAAPPKSILKVKQPPGPEAEAEADPAPGVTHSQSPVHGLEYTPVESKQQLRGPLLSEEEAAKMNNYLRYVQGDGWRLDKYGKEAFNGNTEEPSDLEKLTYFYRKHSKTAPKFPPEQIGKMLGDSNLSRGLKKKYGEDHHEAYLKWCDEVGGPWVALINSKDEKRQMRWKGIKAFLAEKEEAEAGGDASGE